MGEGKRRVSDAGGACAPPYAMGCVGRGCGAQLSIVFWLLPAVKDVAADRVESALTSGAPKGRVASPLLRARLSITALGARVLRGNVAAREGARRVNQLAARRLPFELDRVVGEHVALAQRP